MSDAATGNSGRLWQSVADRLAGEIAAGIFKPGERLDNERELAERYTVHRHTLRRAVAELAGRGLLEVRHGRGTFVQNAPIPYTIGAASRFRPSIADLSREPGGRLLASATMVAPAQVAMRLDLSSGENAIRLDILREADGIPMMLSRHWFPAARVPDVAAHFEKEQSITVALENLGIRGLRRRDTGISTRMPTAKEAAALRQAPNLPVLVWESLKVDDEGVPIDFGIAIIAGERVQLIFNLK